MATKNITISEEAHRRLKVLKKPGESFTDVIQRMTRTSGVRDLAGMLSAAHANELSARVAEGMAGSSRRVQRTVHRLSRFCPPTRAS